MKQAMSLKQFEALVAAYGATPDNWPDNERTPMLSVLDSEPNAAGIMARAERLDGVLDHYLPPASADLQSRILSDMEAMLGNETDIDIIAFPQNPPRRARNAWAIVTGLAACFVGGFIAAPLVLDAMTGSPDLMASLDIISAAFLPTEPL